MSTVARTGRSGAVGGGVMAAGRWRTGTSNGARSGRRGTVARSRIRPVGRRAAASGDRRPASVVRLSAAPGSYRRGPALHAGVPPADCLDDRRVTRDALDSRVPRRTGVPRHRSGFPAVGNSYLARFRGPSRKRRVTPVAVPVPRTDGAAAPRLSRAFDGAGRRSDVAADGYHPYGCKVLASRIVVAADRHPDGGRPGPPDRCRATGPGPRMPRTPIGRPHTAATRCPRVHDDAGFPRQESDGGSSGGASGDARKGGHARHGGQKGHAHASSTVSRRTGVSRDMFWRVRSASRAPVDRRSTGRGNGSTRVGGPRSPVRAGRTAARSSRAGRADWSADR